MKRATISKTGLREARTGSVYIAHMDAETFIVNNDTGEVVYSTENDASRRSLGRTVEFARQNALHVTRIDFVKEGEHTTQDDHADLRIAMSSAKKRFMDQTGYEPEQHLTRFNPNGWEVKFSGRRA